MDLYLCGCFCTLETISVIGDVSDPKISEAQD